MKDRITMLPDSLVCDLKSHLDRTEIFHQQYLKEGYGSAWLLFALDRRYPNSDRQWNCQ